MLAKPTPTRAARPEFQGHTFSVFLSLMFLCVPWVPGRVCHDMVWHPLLNQGVPVGYPRSLKYHRTSLQILVEDLTVLSADGYLGVFVIQQSLGDLLFHILHLKS